MAGKRKEKMICWADLTSFTHSKQDYFLKGLFMFCQGSEAFLRDRFISKYSDDFGDLNNSSIQRFSTKKKKVQWYAANSRVEK